MQYTVYVLRSDDGKLYKGMTKDLHKRLFDHKSKHTRTTARMHSLIVVYTEQFDSFEEARKRELYFKSAAGRRFLKQHIGPLA